MATSTESTLYVLFYSQKADHFKAHQSQDDWIKRGSPRNTFCSALVHSSFDIPAYKDQCTWYTAYHFYRMNFYDIEPSELIQLDKEFTGWIILLLLLLSIRLLLLSDQIGSPYNFSQTIPSIGTP